MKKITLLLILTISTAFGQDLDEALRYIKVGNTYREVDEFNLSEYYLNKAINLITTKFPTQKYWEAAAYENLGLLHRDHDEPEEAQKFFLKALDIYQKNNYTASVRAIQKLMTSIGNQEEYYAGLDVGATGVKLSVLGAKLNVKTKKLEFKVAKKFKNANVNMGVKNISAYKEGAQAIAHFVNDSIASFKIPSERVIIALSSGLVGRIGQDTVLLKEEIKNALGNPNQKIDIVDYVKEAELTIRGAIPQSQWYQSTVIDIGSGNTKGGYYQKPAKAGEFPKMMGIEFPGTKTYASSIEKKYDPKNIQEYITAIDAESRDLALQIRRDFDERRQEMKRRKRVYLLGGASYVANVLILPDSVKEGAITMNQTVINNFKRKAVTDIAGLRNPDISGIKDAGIKNLAETKIGEINNNIFPRDEDIISAAHLVYAFASEVTRSLPAKEIIFLNGTDTAWITGLIRQTIENQYGR
ncbi:MAG: tetratricopeptide repeat protein [Spirosomataceae bacterium]